MDLFGPIHWLHQLLNRPGGRADIVEVGRAVKRPNAPQAPLLPGAAPAPVEPPAPGSLRKAAFETGEPPLLGASSPAPRRTGWEEDLKC